MIIAFDLDGTLIDSAKDIHLALAKAMPLRLSQAETHRFIGAGARALIENVAQAQGDDVDIERTLETFRCHYSEAKTAHSRAFEGIPSLLTQLLDKGYRLAVATNKPGGPAREMINALLPEFFDLVVGPDDVGAAKPNPKMLSFIAKKLCGDLGLFVGDTLVDVETARRANLNCVAVSWGHGQDAIFKATLRDKGVELIDAPAGLMEHLPPRYRT